MESSTARIRLNLEEVVSYPLDFTFGAMETPLPTESPGRLIRRFALGFRLSQTPPPSDSISGASVLTRLRTIAAVIPRQPDY